MINPLITSATFLHPAQGKIRLVKIHGSTSWLVKSNDEVEEREYTINQYSDLSTDKPVWIVVEYSFRDPVISNMFRTYLIATVLRN